MENPIKCPLCGEPFELYVDVVEMDVYTWDDYFKMFTKSDTSQPSIDAYRCGSCYEKVSSEFIHDLDTRGLINW